VVYFLSSCGPSIEQLGATVYWELTSTKVAEPPPAITQTYISTSTLTPSHTQSTSIARSTFSALTPQLTRTPTAATLDIKDAISDQTKSSSVTISPLQNQSPIEGDFVWIIKDQAGNIRDPLSDVVEAVVVLNGDVLDVAIQLGMIPQTLLINQSHIKENSLEYSWSVEIDIDLDGIMDYRIALSKFNDKGETPTEVDLSKDVSIWAYVDLAEPGGSGGWRLKTGEATAWFDVQMDTLHMQAHHSDFHADMQMQVVTKIDDMDNGSYSGEIIAFVPQDTSAQPVSMDTPTPQIDIASLVDKNADWIGIDIIGDVRKKIADIVYVEAYYVDKQLKVVFHLGDVYEKLKINRSELDPSHEEYAWEILLDIDNKTSTGGRVQYQSDLDTRNTFWSSGWDRKFLIAHIYDGFLEKVIDVSSYSSWSVHHEMVLDEDGRFKQDRSKILVYSFNPIDDTLELIIPMDTIHPEMRIGVRTHYDISGDPEGELVILDITEDALTLLPKNITQTPTLTFSPYESDAEIKDSQNDRHDFWDVTVDQINDWEIQISFSYSIESRADLNDIRFGAWPDQCQGKKIYFNPTYPNGEYSGKISGDDAIQLFLDEPGECRVDSFLIHSSSKADGSHIYQEVVKIPITLKRNH